MLHHRKSFLTVAVLASGVLFLSISGCHDKAGDLPLAVTTGVVTLDGKPLTSGTVTFVPDVDKGTTGPTGVGKIGDDGSYRITTVKRDGALIGFHKVRVSSIDSSKPGAPWVIPMRYDHPDHSGLTCEVKAGETNNVPLELTTTP